MQTEAATGRRPKNKKALTKQSAAVRHQNGAFCTNVRRGRLPGATWVLERSNRSQLTQLAMAHTLLREGLHDQEFVARYCTGFEAFRRYLLGEDDGEEKSADWAAVITGVAADTIRDLRSLSATVFRLLHAKSTASQRL